MRQLATGLAIVPVLVAAAFARPFADTPTPSWAFAAIAELAAKGLMEGYPDGTVKGDRAMTRYEMAMVVDGGRPESTSSGVAEPKQETAAFPVAERDT